MSEPLEQAADLHGPANPLLKAWQTPFETPPFDEIAPEHFLPAFEQAFADHAGEIAAIVNDPSVPDFHNTITALERSGRLLAKVSAVFYDLVSAHSNPALLEIDKEVSLRMARHWNPIMMNAVLFGRIVMLHDNRATLKLTGEIADGWLGTSFVPEGAGEAYFAHLDAGLAAAGRTRADIDICQGAEVAFAADEDQLRGILAGRKKELAFSLGGMGSSSTNYYNQAYSRQGWADIAAEVRERWQRGDRDGAAGLVTDDMVLATTLIGTEPMVRARLAVWKDAGVDTVRLYPAGDTLDEKLETLGRAIDLVREMG